MIIVEIAGFLGADPEERFTATGKRVISLRIATRVRQGGRDETVWWRVSIWGDRFDKMLPYLKKGSSVIVIGEMGKPETYVAKDGTTQVSMNLTADILKFSPFGKPENSGGASGQQAARTPETQQFAQEPQQFAAYGASTEQDNFSGDDLPF